MYNANIKTEIINNIIFEMSGYVDYTTLDIMQKVIEKQLVAVNMEEITNLPAEIRTSTEEQNRYYLSLMMIKKKNLRPETKAQYRDAIMRLTSVIEKPLNKMDEIDIDSYLDWYEKRNVAAGGKKNQASTCNNERRYLSAFFTWMRKEKFMDRIDTLEEHVDNLTEANKSREAENAELIATVDSILTDVLPALLGDGTEETDTK